MVIRGRFHSQMKSKEQECKKIKSCIKILKCLQKEKRALQIKTRSRLQKERLLKRENPRFIET